MSRYRRGGRMRYVYVVMAVAGLLGGVLKVAGWVERVEDSRPTVERVVAVADTLDEWKAGVRDVPLSPGESLLFDFGQKADPVWNMAGVDYPLVLTGWNGDREVVSVEMVPCASDVVAECPKYRGAVSARWWIETRPTDSVQSKKKGPALTR